MSAPDPTSQLTAELNALHASTHALSGAWAPRVETAQQSYLAANLVVTVLLRRLLTDEALRRSSGAASQRAALAVGRGVLQRTTAALVQWLRARSIAR